MLKSIRHVVCGMSGGVDSAVTAALLKKKGFYVTGLFMKNWDDKNEEGICTGELDREDAHYVCRKLNIPLREVSFVKEYWTEVFCNMVEGYANGVTPNPDILCNKHVKFGPFLDHALNEIGADAIATGHYARNSAGQFLEKLDLQKGCKLLQSCDPAKDQTLFLSQIPQKALQRTMFPVGGLTKREVKDIAHQLGLDRLVQKKESTGMCFIGLRHFQTFIQGYLEPKPGDFIDIETGEVVGKHKGVHYWTIGQRAHIGGQDAAYFIADRCPTTQRILVAKGTKHPALHHISMVTSPPHWIHEPPSDLRNHNRVSCEFRFQHTAPTSQCQILQQPDQTLLVTLSKPHRAVTAGQYAVFYQGLECLGSAQITDCTSMFNHCRENHDLTKSSAVA